MNWQKIDITTESGNTVSAQAPVIISASRSTDIPAFYSEWLVNRLTRDYVVWKNPFNGSLLYVTFKKARLIVFWSKNPRPIIKHLDFIKEKIPNFYFQFTLNDYDKEKLEPNVPNLQYRIDTFIELSEKIGKEKVIWRFDPYILTDKISVDDLLKKTENIGNQLKNHTKKLVFSYADIKTYKKVMLNLKRSSIRYHEFTPSTMIEIAEGLKKLNEKWNFKIATCAEEFDLKKYGIGHNHCIDDDLIIELFHDDKILMEYLGIKFPEPELFNQEAMGIKTKDIKDKGQREFCGCIISKDIGEYNTCPHLCEYCYANTSKELALNNYKKHKENPDNEMILGENNNE